MAAQKPGIPKGTRDFGPADVQKRRHILHTIETVFKKYGFMPIETPVMENLSTLEGKYGEEGDKLLFRVVDSGEYYEKFIDSFKKNNQVFIQDLRKVIEYALEFIAPRVIELQIEKIDEELVGRFLDELDEEKVAGGTPTLSGQVKLKLLVKELKGEIILITQLLRQFWYLHGTFNNSQVQSLHYLKEYIHNSEGFIEKVLKNITDHRLLSTRSNELNKEISEKGLRYDLTVPFARYVVMNRNSITFPFKRYQMQPVWRADRPQKGRYREFWQCDADVVGSDSLLNELDLVQIYDEAFRNLGIPGYELRINNRKILAGIAEVVRSKELLSTVSVAIDKLDKIGEEGVRKELGEQGFSTEELDRLFSIITIKGENRELLASLKTKLAASEEGLKGIAELEFVLDAIDTIEKNEEEEGAGIHIKVDFSLARGLSYYTGCIFEVVSTEGSLRSSIGGGGRYDNLTGIFGLPGVSGVGISFGLDRIYDVMEELQLFPSTLQATSTQVLICTFDNNSQQYALAPLKQLRNAGIASEIYPDLKKLGKQLDYANALKIPYAVIIGDNEMASGRLVLKNLNEGTQQEATIEEIIQQLS